MGLKSCKRLPICDRMNAKMCCTNEIFNLRLCTFFSLHNQTTLNIHDLSKNERKKTQPQSNLLRIDFFSVVKSFCVEGLRIILICVSILKSKKKRCCYRFDFPNCFITINDGSNQVNVY